MAKFEFHGLDEYVSLLEQLGRDTESICSSALYAGAGVVADAIRDSIEKLPETTEENAVFGYITERPTLGVTKRQRQGLLDGLGIAKKEDEFGKYNVKVGFDGYNKVKTRKFPKGQPNVLVARGLESGSSAKLKTPFVRPAVNRVRKEAEAAMAKAADKEIEKILNESE